MKTKISKVFKTNQKTPKHILLLFASLLVTANVLGQARIMPFLYLENKKGETIEIHFTDGTMSIKENQILIGTPSKQFDFDYDDVEKFYFKDCYKASLLNLTVSGGELTPVFDGNVLNYTVNVPYTTSSITITATKNDESATVTGAGVKNLVVGENSFKITVTADGGATTLNYTITVNRAPEVTGINSEDAGLEVKIYPNPTEGKFTVHIPDRLNEFELISVYTMNGQKIEDKRISDEYTDFDINHYSDGVYLLKIFKKSGQSINKILVKQ